MNKKTLKYYIPHLVKSLRFPNKIKTVEDYFAHTRTKPTRDGYSWAYRVSRWSKQGITLYTKELKVIHEAVTYECLPLFPQLWAKAILDEKMETEVAYNENPYHDNSCAKERDRTKILRREFNAQQKRLVKESIKEKTMLSNTKKTVNKVIDQNKEAGMLAAELTVGRTANEFIMAKIMKTLPWYKRMFVGKDGSSWLGKLVVAQAANALIQQTSDNDRLQRIGEAMVKESVIETTVYSEQVTGLISGLEEAVSMPFLDKIMPNK